jgi:dipeptidyl aminopeptidase/acylaminoacyl peptidase
MSSIPFARRPVLRGLQALAVLLLATALAPARAEVRQAPSANYRQAQKYSKANMDPLTYSTSVTPGWIGKSDSFWYSYRTSKGTSFWRVDPVKKSKTELFNREKIASQLAELSRKPAEATNLNLTRTSVNAEGNKFNFAFEEMLYEFDLKAEKLVSKGKAPAPPAGSGGPGGFRGRRRVADEAGDDEPQQKEKGKTDERTGKGRRGTGGPGGPGPMRPARVASPDGKSVLFTKDNNLYLTEAGKEKEAKQLTRDGGQDYTFMLGIGFGGQGGGRGGLRALGAAQPPRSPWSSDSRYFYATRQDGRNIQELFLVDSLASPRPKLEKYKYSMPGEDAIRKSELYIGSRDAKELVRVAPKWRDETYSDLRWSKTGAEIRFIRMDRLLRNFELCALDAGSAECRTLITEGFDKAPVFYQPPRYLDESGEMVWWSERSGWGHYYLYDRDGKLKNPITSGSWRASRIVALDEKSRVLWFVGNGREQGENIYYEHLYSVKLDGTGLALLNPGNAHHLAAAGFGGMGGRGFPPGGPGATPSMQSPSRQFLVDNTSRVDQAPETVLRDARGNKVMDLEKADLSRLQEYGWRTAETFVVKAGDGVTDLYGNMWKPFDFDPKKKYPIIANVYPGPQMEGVTHTFTAYSQNMQLAQLGFIVIQVGHRGGAPTRSKAYASYGYFNLRDYGLADKKTAIEQLAARYPWIDLKKVGIFGHSGGGFMSAAALLQKPYNEFFTAAVASAGNHDNNIYNHGWAERYHGMKAIIGKEVAKDGTKDVTKDATKRPENDGDDIAPAAPPVKGKAATRPPVSKSPAAPPTKFEIKVPTNAELAANLKGRLLLVHGEIDNNVHPANTMRLVDALIKANKRFDMLIIPGQRHGFGTAQPYLNRRMMEFFAEHLLGDRRSGADILDNGE